MATYTLSATSSTVNEGSAVTITLDTVGIPNNTLVPYTITGTGIDTDDFVGLASLSGNFIILNNQGRITLNIKNDLKTESDETFVLRLSGVAGGLLIDSTNLISWSRTSGSWSKSFTVTNLDRNWGLYRSWYGSNPNNNWGSSPATATSNLSGTVALKASGKNVDIVIVDGVLDPSHPEFAVNSDGTGGSRVKYFNWYNLNIPGDAAYGSVYNPPITTNRTSSSDDSRHAAHVAGIAAGNTQGWAPNANIYNISPQYVTGGVQYTYLYKYILEWHNQKRSVGNMTPTIVNSSWYSRYTIPYGNITSLTYRGSTVSGPFTINQLATYGIIVNSSNNVLIGLRNAAMDADIQACIDAGIIMVACAGNDSVKITTDPTDIDYNNTVTASGINSGNPIYFNQGSSPGSTSTVICVGNISSSISSPGADRKQDTSSCGPRVDLYAPGALIASAWLTTTGATTGTTPVPDPRNSAYYIAKLSGTSMAAPQVTGMLACALEASPTLSHSAARNLIIANAKLNQIPDTAGGANDLFSLQGSPNRYLTLIDTLYINTGNDDISVKLKSVDPIVVPTYTLSTTSSTVNEGSNVTIILDTSGIPNNTLVPFTITGTGIGTDDFTGLTSLSGNFNVRSNQGRITLDLKKDLKTEFDETFYLTLTGTGANQNIGVIVKDTSTTTSNIVVKFSITSVSSAIYEGSYANFFIKAVDLTPGTVVPYRIFGIQADDIAEGVLTGVLTFLPTGTANQTQANLTLTVLDDKKSEGLETIVLLLDPTFPYSLQVSSTITVLDTSVTTRPDFVINANRTRVVEGSNVTLSLVTSNIPDGTIIPWRIIGQKGDITLGDFDRISSLDGYFPAISSNIANITLEIRDDYLFEQAEFFYIEIPNRNTSSPLIEIIDSGNTYLSSAATHTGNIVLRFLDTATLRANIGGMAIAKSYWKDTSGQLSENMYLQGKTQYATEDSIAFYQPFSYVIRSSKSIEEWGSSIRSVLHPAGLSVFSEINNETMPYNAKSLEVKVTNDTEIDTFSAITIDNPALRASNASNSLTADSVTSLFNL
jgi:hypothetical protein